MATYSTNEFKAGLKVMHEGNPFAILENEYVKPGKVKHSTASKCVT